ncbi:TetR/AcrR family transcriptional regulator [Nocardia speluncae]|uniref:TetR/AcrR family transcriptional regulator n=1 Tax=Nocardia speluncae TaxID=419477 RepID=A0A846XC84_9NOCA|nr:TetR/AcrR family transcriptional regulator [Nocardia speluncae]NKY33542.1 TetR/AcrR family transcriptional regulator [Nocardia speluncae]
MSPDARARTPEARHRRSEHLLDVAAELLLRLGYRHVTVDDIAGRARVGKGTVYLHYKSKDELLLAVLQREVVRSIDQLVTMLREDAMTTALHRLTEVHFLGVMRRPLLRALYTGDLDVLGNLAVELHRNQGGGHHRAFDDYLHLLAAHGLLRDDLPVDEISYGYHAILHGYLSEDSYDRGVPDISLERKAQLLAATVHRTFEVPQARPEALREISERAIRMFTETADLGRAQLRPATN